MNLLSAQPKVCFSVKETYREIGKESKVLQGWVDR